MDLNDINPLYVKLTQKLTPKGSETPESERDMFLDSQLALIRGWSQDIARESLRVNQVFTSLGYFHPETLSFRERTAFWNEAGAAGALAAKTKELARMIASVFGSPCGGRHETD